MSIAQGAARALSHRAALLYRWPDRWGRLEENRMSTARHGRTNDDSGRWADAQAALQVSNETQNRRAVRVVAGRATDLDDCTELLAMLGLDARADHSV